MISFTHIVFETSPNQLSHWPSLTSTISLLFLFLFPTSTSQDEPFLQTHSVLFSFSHRRTAGSASTSSPYYFVRNHPSTYVGCCCPSSPNPICRDAEGLPRRAHFRLSIFNFTNMCVCLEMRLLSVTKSNLIRSYSLPACFLSFVSVSVSFYSFRSLLRFPVLCSVHVALGEFEKSRGRSGSGFR